MDVSTFPNADMSLFSYSEELLYDTIVITHVSPHTVIKFRPKKALRNFFLVTDQMMTETYEDATIAHSFP